MPDSTRDNQTPGGAQARDTSKGDVTNPKFSDPNAPQVGGVSSKNTSVGDDANIFTTEGSQPVRDKSPQDGKGTPVTRFFTKDGTPVEPSTVPPAVSPSNLAGFDVSKRNDLVEATEYLDEGGNVVTHDSLKASKEGKDANGSNKK